MTTIAKKLAQIKPGALLAGLDLGLDKIAVVVLDDNGQRVDRFMATQSREGYEYSAWAVAARRPEAGSLQRVGGHGTHELLLETSRNLPRPRAASRFAWSTP